jgi:chromosome segregation ATPase
MNLEQAGKLIEWLDEERRRDKTMIAALEERLSKQQDYLEQMQRRMNNMESDQTAARSQFVANERQIEALDLMRREVRQMVEAAETKRLTAEREAERRNALSIETQVRPLHQLSEQVKQLERQISSVGVLQNDRERQNTQLLTLQQRVDDQVKRTEEPERRVAMLEETVRDLKRRLAQLEADTPEAYKQIDTLRPKVSLIEDMSLRLERRITEAQTLEATRRDQMQQFIDQQTLMLQQRDSQVNELLKRFTDQEASMDENLRRFETWADVYRQMKKIIDDFDRIGERLERRINEVSETQRFSEDRFRQEWNDHREEESRERKHFIISNDEVWRSHDKDFERFVEKLNELEKRFAPLDDQISRIWGLERARAQMYRDRYQALLHEYDTISATNSGNAPSAASAAAPSPYAPPASYGSATGTGNIPAVGSSGYANYSTSTGTYPTIKNNGNPPK